MQCTPNDGYVYVCHNCDKGDDNILAIPTCRRVKKIEYVHDVFIFQFSSLSLTACDRVCACIHVGHVVFSQFHWFFVINVVSLGHYIISYLGYAIND